jgi:hypothetical protein
MHLFNVSTSFLLLSTMPARHPETSHAMANYMFTSDSNGGRHNFRSLSLVCRLKAFLSASGGDTWSRHDFLLELDHILH